MDNIIEIKNLTFSYKENQVFDDLNLEIKRGTFTTIVGPNNSGKSTLIKLLLGIIKTDSHIRINKKDPKYIDLDKIGYIPNNISDSLLMDAVLDEIMLNNKKIDNKELDKLLDEFNLNDKKLENPKKLSDGEQQLVYIISSLLKNPKIIICEKAFSNIDNLVKDKILKILKKLCSEKGITIINVTNDLEECLYGDYIVILANKKAIVNDKKEVVLNNEKIFKKNNLKLPFMAELSLKLNYYNLINNVQLDMNRMINQLWK